MADYEPVDPDARPSATKPKIKLPAGYDSEDAFLQEMRTDFSDDDSADFDNHQAGVEDLQFLVGQQWDPVVVQQRTDQRKPSLTVNRMPAFVGQVIGKRRQNETEIHIAPAGGGDKDTALVREGLIRSIQKDSKAKFAYDNALLGSVACGIGNFQLDTYYESDDVWEQCIRIKTVNDHFAVVWDRTITDLTGRDADHCFIVDNMPQAMFERLWPWARPADIMQTRFWPELVQTGWWTNSDVRVVAYWKMRTEKRTIALMRDNSTQDITDWDQNDAPRMANIQSRADGSPFIRDVNRRYAERYICSGTDILEGPYRLPIDRVPVFRVPGWEVRIGSKTHRWGLLRFLKDPQRLHNFWRSVIAEKIMRSPKQTWMASNTAIQGREAQWRASNTSDDPLLIWNQESGQKPERVTGIEVEGVLIEQAATTAQDMKDVSNIHEANLGMPSNEVSGRGIEARVAVSDTGTALYHDNLNEAIEECGRVANQLLPVIYDTPRTVKIIQPDGAEEMVAINQTVGTEAKRDITKGNYTVKAVTGRNYETKRQESSESMLALAQSLPEVMGVGADLIVAAMDWPDADKLAKRLKNAVPPQLLDPSERTPAQAQALQGQAQAGAAASQVQNAKDAATLEQMHSTSVLNYSRAQNYQTQAQVAPQKLQNESMLAAGEQTSRELNDNLKTIDVGLKSGG